MAANKCDLRLVTNATELKLLWRESNEPKLHRSSNLKGPWLGPVVARDESASPAHSLSSEAG
jgi:hypothetical protein